MFFRRHVMHAKRRLLMDVTLAVFEHKKTALRALKTTIAAVIVENEASEGIRVSGGSISRLQARMLKQRRQVEPQTILLEGEKPCSYMGK